MAVFKYILGIHLLVVGIDLYGQIEDTDDYLAQIEKEAELELQNKLKSVTKHYEKEIDPIFKKACYDCHSDQTIYPWYYNIPLVQQLIDSDIKEAKQHIFFTGTFPFDGHGKIDEDLKAIKKSLTEDSMPPFKYKIMHDKARVSEIEKKKIFSWIDEALKKLKQ